MINSIILGILVGCAIGGIYLLYLNFKIGVGKTL